MSSRGTRGRGTRGRGRGCKGARADSLASDTILNLDTSETPKLNGAVLLLCDEAYQWWLTFKEGTQPNRLTWDLFKIFRSKHVRANYTEVRRREFLNLTQGDCSVAEYEAEFLRLSPPQREHKFTVLIKKAKIAEEVKCTECQNQSRGKAKRDAEPLNSGLRPRKKARSDGPVRVGLTVVPTGMMIYQYCDRIHLGKCWRATGACLRCVSTEHRVKDCPLRSNQMQAPVNETV
ncbi:uncharacterized protein LOC108451295 [Gossypium arboreum]|uniref:uncharacterized protein LOC108451295 n=1 Tax=Gossypium arboreum TaxID=29729 RepID=UPI0008191F14|nr:uncharacterized protein LOC108451295 [Gossypium arboreum]